MLCSCCNEFRSHIRCEGCQKCFCVPCMNKHHDELLTQFDLLANVHKGLRSAFEEIESKWQNDGFLSCFHQINNWEDEMIEKVQRIAQQSRQSADEMIGKNLAQLRHRLDQISLDFQQRKLHGSYLDRDIAMIKNRMDQLNWAINRFQQTIQVKTSMTEKIDWNSLVKISSTTNFDEIDSQPADGSMKNQVRNENRWSHLRDFIRRKNSMKKEKTLTNKEVVSADIDQSIVLNSVTSLRSDNSNVNWRVANYHVRRDRLSEARFSCNGSIFSSSFSGAYDERSSCQMSDA